MEKFKQYNYIILISIVVLGFIFYWLSIRPVLVKGNCATKIIHNDGVTTEQAEKNYLEYKDKCGGNNPSFYCFELSKAISANPPKVITRSATQAEYTQCLREHGL